MSLCESVTSMHFIFSVLDFLSFLFPDLLSYLCLNVTSLLFIYSCDPVILGLDVQTWKLEYRIILGSWIGLDFCWIVFRLVCLLFIYFFISDETQTSEHFDCCHATSLGFHPSTRRFTHPTPTLTSIKPNTKLEILANWPFLLLVLKFIEIVKIILTKSISIWSTFWWSTFFF